MSLQKWSDHIWVLALQGEPAFSEELDALRQQAAQQAVMPHVVLDLSGLRQVNSSNLSDLLKVRKMAVDGEAQLRLAAPSDPVWAVLLTTGLDKVFEFSPDVATALAALKMILPSWPGQAGQAGEEDFTSTQGLSPVDPPPGD